MECPEYKIPSSLQLKVSHCAGRCVTVRERAKDLTNTGKEGLLIPALGAILINPAKALIKYTHCWKVGLKPCISLNACQGSAFTRMIHG